MKRVQMKLKTKHIKPRGNILDYRGNILSLKGNLFLKRIITNIDIYRLIISMNVTLVTSVTSLFPRVWKKVYTHIGYIRFFSTCKLCFEGVTEVTEVTLNLLITIYGVTSMEKCYLFSVLEVFLKPMITIYRGNSLADNEKSHKWWV